MEDTLRGKSTVDREQLVRLNPCFNGRYSQREQDIRILYISGIGIYKTKQIGFC